MLEAMEVAADIRKDDTITPDGGKLIVGPTKSVAGFSTFHPRL